MPKKTAIAAAIPAPCSTRMADGNAHITRRIKNSAGPIANAVPLAENRRIACSRTNTNGSSRVHRALQRVLDVVQTRAPTLSRGAFDVMSIAAQARADRKGATVEFTRAAWRRSAVIERPARRNGAARKIDTHFRSRTPKLAYVPHSRHLPGNPCRNTGCHRSAPTGTREHRDLPLAEINGNSDRRFNADGDAWSNR